MTSDAKYEKTKKPTFLHESTVRFANNAEEKNQKFKNETA